MGKQVVVGLYVGLLFDARELLRDDEPAKNVNEKHFNELLFVKNYGFVDMW